MPIRNTRLATIAALLFTITSCSVVRGVANAPGQIVGAVTGEPADTKSIDLDAVRDEALRFADRIVAQVDVGGYAYTSQDESPEAAERALSWRVGTAERAFQLAAQSRPVAALADLVALCAYEQELHEAYWSTTLGENDRPMLEVWTSLRQQGLDAADRFLPKAQSKALRDLLTRWVQGLEDASVLLRTGAPRFEDLANRADAAEQTNSLLGVLGLDPLDSIEPAARELARSRQLGERAVFLAQRLPRTVSWRAELLALRAARQPGVVSLLQDADRTSKAAESLAATAKVLPERLRAEGDALILRVSSELTTQRAGIVSDLERTNEPTRALLAQVQQTLEAATTLSQALESTTEEVDQFVAHVAPRDPAGARSDESDAPRDAVGAPLAGSGPARKRFDPVEYTTLATQLSGALRELNTAVTNLDHSLPTMQRFVDEAAARADRSVEKAWRLAVWLVLIAVVAIATAGALGVVLVRGMSARRARGAERKASALRLAAQATAS